MATMVAADLGAQSGRVAVGRLDGGRLEVTTVHRFPNVPVRTSGVLRWDVLSLFEGVLEGLRIAGRDARRIDSVGVDSWAVDFGLLDRRGQLIQNPVHYRDPRRAAAVDGVLAEIPARELYQLTGIQLMPINTVFELAAMAAVGDPALASADRLLMIPDLFHVWLGGAAVTEFTNATTTQCFDAHSRAWADDLLARLAVPVDLLPEVVEPGTELGPMSADVAEDVGLGDVMIVAGATHDTGSAVAAIPFTSPESVFISAGTWSLVGVELLAPRIDDATYAANLTNEGGVAGTVRVLRNVTGLWLLHECRRTWEREGFRSSFEELLAEAAQAPALESLVDPDHPLLAGTSVPQRIAELCAAGGQPVPETRGAFTRCILESLALKHAQTIDLIGRTLGVAPRVVHVVGGGARNEALCRWTASASGLPLVAGPVEATEIGNLLLQAITLGEIASLDDARQVVRDSFPLTTYEPEDHGLWREARVRFDALTTRGDQLTGVEA
jgi:rhamnulokinase